MSWTIGPARREEAVSALALALGRSVVHAADLLAAGRFDVRGLFVLRDHGVVNAAFACQPFPGASALAWLPAGEFDESQADALVAAGLDYLRSRKAKIVEVIVEPNESDGLVPLARKGFAPIGPMQFLSRNLDDLPDPPDVELVAYPDVDAGLFAKVLESTYIETLDFPELGGIRSMEEVLAGYLSNPDARPERWWLALKGGEAIGILMLTELETLENWDLTYLGVTPSYRRHGVGKALVAAALREVREREGRRLDVAVDARNAPAIQLYLRLGFQLVGERLVSLMILDA